MNTSLTIDSEIAEESGMSGKRNALKEKRIGHGACCPTTSAAQSKMRFIPERRCNASNRFQGTSPDN